MKRLFNFIVILVALFCWICCENLVEEEGPIEYSKPSSVEVSASSSTESLDISLTAKPNGQSVKSVASASFVYSLSEDLSNPTTVSAIASGDAFTATFRSLDYGKRLYFQATIVSALGARMTSSVWNILIPAFSEFVKVSAPELVEATSSTITLKSDYQSVEGIAIAERGFCWSTELAVPNIDSNRVIAESAFQCAIEGLEQMQTINARAYVKDAAGNIAYSEMEQFTTGTVHVSEVSLNKTELVLNEGESQTLVATVKPDDAANQAVSWKSSDTGIATVDANGKVTAVKAGTATITVTTVDGAKTASCVVTVSSSTSCWHENETYYWREYQTPIVKWNTYGQGGTIDLSDLMTYAQAKSIKQLMDLGLITDVSVELLYNNADSPYFSPSVNGHVITISQTSTQISNAPNADHMERLRLTFGCSEGHYVRIDMEVLCRVDTSSSSPEYVDLGLSVKWATCNLGASKPEEYGLYYQWGDTQGYGSDTSDGKYFACQDNNGKVTYKWCNGTDNALTKYNTKSYYGPVVDNKTVLDPEDDAAHTALGGKWRMPTDAEWIELRNNCTWTWTTVNGINGYRVTSKKSGYTDKSIFLPAAGYRSDGYLNSVGSYGYYWSSSLDTYGPFNAFNVDFHSVGVGRGSYHRYLGQSIRPVYGDAVQEVHVSSVSLNKTTLSLEEGESETLTATVSPSNATNKGVNWKSSNSSVATVDSNGKVTAVKAGSATITVTTVDGSKTANCSVTVTSPSTGSAEYVDLGLSVKWATCNLGASKPEECGGYYQWAGTKDVTSTSIYLNWKNTPYQTNASATSGSATKWSKYVGSTTSSYKAPSATDKDALKTVLDPEDDAAHVALGGKWRMPTDAEWTELRNNCTWTWTTVNGVKGYRVTSKKSGYTDKSIFLPAAGYRSGDYLGDVDSDGYYWSSSLDADYPYYACNVSFYPSSVYRNYYNRYFGQSIRPVSE